MSLSTMVVVFGAGAGAGAASGVQIFADEVANVDSLGKEKTEFYPGDDFYFLVIVPDEYRLVEIKATTGLVVALGEVVREQLDRLLFAETGSQLSLAQLPDGEVSPVWYGQQGLLTIDGQQISADLAPCIADLAYSYRALQYRLTAPADLDIGPDADYPVGLVVYVEAVT